MTADKSKPRPFWANDALLAVILTVFAALAFAALGAQAKYLSHSMHGFTITFWRNFWGLFFMLPWLYRQGFSSLRPERLRTFFGRAAISLASMLCGFTSLAYLTFADATALSFTAPLFATALAAMVLGETVRLRRWSATIIGFIGVLVVVRPGTSDVGIGQILGLSGAFLTAIVILVVKRLSRTESPDAIVAYMVLLLTPMAFVCALPVWTWPDPWDWPFVIGMGLAGTLGHLAWTRAVAKVDASAVAPYDYIRLVFAILIGIAAFNEHPDTYTLIGSFIIVCAGIYIARREALLGQQAARAAVAATVDARNPIIKQERSRD